MKRGLILIFTCFLVSTFVKAQKPKDGSYTYKVAFDEWGGKTLGATCTVVIKGDSIKVIHNGKPNLTGNKGDIMDEGIIMKHKKTGKWIIGHSKDDVNAKELGGCGSGPAIIDFKNKKWWTC